MEQIVRRRYALWIIHTRHQIDLSADFSLEKLGDFFLMRIVIQDHIMAVDLVSLTAGRVFLQFQHRMAIRFGIRIPFPGDVGESNSLCRRSSPMRYNLGRLHLFRPEAGYLQSLRLCAKADTLGKPLAFLLENRQAAFMRFYVLRSCQKHTSSLRSYSTLQAALHLRSFIAGIMLAVKGDAGLIVLPELFQFFGAVLRTVHAENDRACYMATVQRTDPAHKTVVKGIIGFIAVLPALDRLMIRRAVGVRGNLPSIAAEVIMVLSADLLRHQTKAAHNIPSDGRFQTGMDARSISDGNTVLCDPCTRLPDRGIVISCSSKDLLKGVICAGTISLWQSLITAVRIHHQDCLGLCDILQLIAGQHNSGRHNLLNRLIRVKRNKMAGIPAECRIVPIAGCATQKFSCFSSCHSEELRQLPLKLLTAFAEPFDLPCFIGRGAGELSGFLYAAGNIFQQIGVDGIDQTPRGKAETLDLLRRQHYSSPCQER